MSITELLNNLKDTIDNIPKNASTHNLVHNMFENLYIEINKTPTVRLPTPDIPIPNSTADKNLTFTLIQINNKINELAKKVSTLSNENKNLPAIDYTSPTAPQLISTPSTPNKLPLTVEEPKEEIKKINKVSINSGDAKYANQLVLKTSNRGKMVEITHPIFSPDPSYLNQAVRSALGSLKVQITSIRILSDSKDVQVSFATFEDANLARERSDSWIDKVHKNITLATPNKQHAIILHKFPVHFTLDNAQTLLSDEYGPIKTIRYLAKPKSNAYCCSIIVLFNNPESVIRILSAKVNLGGMELTLEKWNAKKKDIQCTRCAKWDHKELVCKAEEETCGRCSLNHATISCRASDNDWRCTNCGTNLPSWHKGCTKRFPTPASPL